MNRRGFIASLAAAAAGLLYDPELLLWRAPMSRALLKLSGGSVHDYATISDDSPRPTHVTRPEGGDVRRHIFTSFDPAEPLLGFEHAGGYPAQHHRPPAPAFHVALHVARATEQTFDGVRGGDLPPLNPSRSRVRISDLARGRRCRENATRLSKSSRSYGRPRSKSLGAGAAAEDRCLGDQWAESARRLHRQRRRAGVRELVGTLRVRRACQHVVRHRLVAV